MTSPLLRRPHPRNVLRRTNTRTRRALVPPQLRLSDNPAAAVLRAARTQPVFRDDIAESTDLSIATVNRQVGALLSCGLLRERPDRTVSGAVGRPRVPVQVDTKTLVTVGVHIGSVVTRILLVDLSGRMLGSIEIATPPEPQEVALSIIAHSAKAFLDRVPGRRALWVGVACAGRIDPASALVDHPRLAWQQAPVAEVFGNVLGLPVSVAPHVAAMAAAELLLPSADVTQPQQPSSSLYIYARESVGVAITLHDRVHTPSTGPGSIAHVPTGSDEVCSCGRTGCLEVTVSDDTLLHRAITSGVVPRGEHPRKPAMAEVYRAAEAGSAAARALLFERAEILGRAAAWVRDVFGAERVVWGGQACTAYRPALALLEKSFSQTTTLPPAQVRTARFGNRVQEAAAAVTSLDAFYTEPLAAMRRVAD